MTARLLALLALACVGAAPPNRIWRERVIASGHRGAALAVAFSPDGKRLALSTWYSDPRKDVRDHSVQIRDTTAPGYCLMVDRGRAYHWLCYSPDGKSLLGLRGNEQDLVWWDTATGAQLRSSPYNSPNHSEIGPRFAKDGRRLAGCSDLVAWVRDLNSGRTLHALRPPTRRWSGFFSHDLRFLAVFHHQDVDLWDVEAGKPVASLLDHRGPAGPGCFSADDRLLAVASNRQTDDEDYRSEVRLWAVPGGRLVRTAALGPFYCHSLAFSPDSRLLTVAGQRDLDRPWEVRLLETATGGELARRVFPESVRRITPPAWQPGGRTLAVGCDDGTIRLWDVTPPAAAKGGGKP